MGEEFFDGPAIGNDDDDWLNTAPAKCDKHRLPEKVEAPVPTVIITVIYPHGDRGPPDVVDLKLTDSINSLLDRCEARYYESQKKDSAPLFFLRYGDELREMTPNTTLESYGVNASTSTATIHVDVGWREMEKDVEVFATEAEAQATKKKRWNAALWIVLKTQGNAELYPGLRHGANAGFIVAKKTLTFSTIKNAVDSQFSLAVRFKLDGDFVEEDDTPESLDLEDMDCIDFISRT